MENIDFIRANLSEAEMWGQLAEEAAELAQAALKMQRFCLGNNLPRSTVDACYHAVLEEYADVALCVKVAEVNKDTHIINAIAAEKMKRWAAHLAANMGRKYD